MNKELIPHVFASLQSLERYLTDLKAMVNDSSDSSVRALLPQFEQTVKKMRRTANKLQLHFAASDATQTIRSLRIFYGLNHMVRPEILAAYMLLTKGAPVFDTTTPEAASASRH